MIKFLPEEEQLRITTFIDTVNNPYQKNKKMSIMMVEVLLKNNAKWLDFFKSNPKQDDLADSLLMTLHYFEKQHCSFLEKQDLGNPARKISRTKSSFLEKSRAKKNEKKSGDVIESVVEDESKNKPEVMPIIDAESSAMIEEKKSKRRNRLLVNKKHKDITI